jgi:pilus assembly protein CpaC
MVQPDGINLASALSWKKRSWMVGIFLLCLGVFQVQISEAKKSIALTVGQSKVVKFDFQIQKAATGAPAVCVINRTDLSEILINAKGVGETNILLWDDNQQLREELIVTVSINDSARLAKELETIFENIEGVKTKTVGNSVVVEGEVFSRKDLDRVNSILGEMAGTINLVKMSPLLEKILTAEIQKAIGHKNVYVVKAKDSFLLEGTVSSEIDKERAGKIAAAYTPDIVNVIKVNIPEKVEKVAPVDTRMVQMTMNIMQIENEVLKELGFNWNPGASTSAVGTASRSSGEGTSVGTITGTITNLFPKMRRLSDAGKARSLFQQSVVTKTGDKANFFVGDEIPIQVAQQGGTMSVEYKKIGLTLNFSPVIGHSGVIQTFVEVESSAVNGEGQGGAPKVRQTKLQSVISVKSSESMALGGLIGQREARAFTTPSGNADAVVQVNDSTKFQHNKSQILIFVTPEILGAGSDAVSEMGGKVKNSFKEYEMDNLEKPKGK